MSEEQNNKSEKVSKFGKAAEASRASVGKITGVAKGVTTMVSKEVQEHLTTENIKESSVGMKAAMSPMGIAVLVALLVGAFFKPSLLVFAVVVFLAIVYVKSKFMKNAPSPSPDKKRNTTPKAMPEDVPTELKSGTKEE